jgi:hypothetical protein
MKILSKTFVMISMLLLLTSCGGKSLADSACETYESGDLSRIIPAFAALAREEPLYLDYLEYSQRFVFYQEALLKDVGNDGSILDRPVIGDGSTWYEFDIAKTSLDLFCAR